MRINPCGEQAIIIDIEPTDAETTGLSTLHTVLKLQAIMTAWSLPGLIDFVPASQTLLVMLDTKVLTPKAVAERIAQCDLAAPASISGESADIVEVPVRYDGPDLVGVAEILGWSTQELVRRHQEADWMSAFGGFAPGFSYLTPTQQWPDVPRLDTPRAAIPAGAVGLAGQFSGVYPQASPGGWQLIGSTTATMWDCERTDRPALIRPGDSVKFVEVR